MEDKRNEYSQLLASLSQTGIVGTCLILFRYRSSHDGLIGSPPSSSTTRRRRGWAAVSEFSCRIRIRINALVCWRWHCVTSSDAVPEFLCHATFLFLFGTLGFLNRQLSTNVYRNRAILLFLALTLDVPAIAVLKSFTSFPRLFYLLMYL